MATYTIIRRDCSWVIWNIVLVVLRTIGATILGSTLAIGAVALSVLFSPPLFDWLVFWEAPLSNPYSRYGYLNPYWLKWIIAPLHLATNDYRIAWGLWSMVTILVLVFVLKNNKLALIMAISSPYFLHLILNGQVDVIVIVGYWLLKRDSVWGIPLLLTKPQSMIGSMLTWATRADKKRLMQAVGIGMFLLIVGFLLYGNWIRAMIDNIQNDLFQPVNVAHVFHLPILGVILFITGVWKNNLFLSGLATLFITPYIAMHSLWVYWTAWLMERPNKWLVVVFAIANWYIALRFTI